MSKQRNFVKKHMDSFNRPVTQKDRKKASKHGHTKHKGGPTLCRYCGEGLELAPAPGCPADVCDWCFSTGRKR